MTSKKPQFVGERTKLQDVAKTISERNRDGHCTSVYSVTNSQGFVPSEAYFSKEVFSKELKTYRVVKRNMIAYNPSRINVGSVALQDKADEVVVSPLYVVFSVDETKVLPDYIVRFLRSKPGLAQIAFQSIGTVRNNLKFKALGEISISLPPLIEQKTRLVALASIEFQIRRCTEIIEKLDSLVKSRFVEMFLNAEYPITTIGECAKDIHYGTSEKASSEGKYIYLRMNNIKDDGFLDLCDVKRITLDGKALENCLVRKGDLLFNRTNSRDKVGKTCVFPFDEEMIIAGYIIRVRLDERVNSVYLSAFMNLGVTKRFLRSIAKGAVHQANINAKQLASIEFPLPPIEVQESFVDFVRQVDKSRFVAQQQIEKLQLLYDSLAQEYFGD